MLSDTLNKPEIRRKYCYVMGDYNINLLSEESHVPTSEFVDSIFSNHFVPIISKPTRLSENSATLIDNIFSNDINSESLQLMYLIIFLFFI